MEVLRWLMVLAFLGMAAVAGAQVTPALTLAWDFAVSDEAAIDTFVLQRRAVAGVYPPTDLQTVAKGLRVVSDPTVTAGTVVCYRLFAQKTFTTPPALLVRSAPSNEVCGAFVAGPINLRLQ